MPERRQARTNLRLAIPGRRAFLLTHIVLDFNGTLAVDGKLIPGVKGRLRELSQRFTIVVLTADTFGTAHRALHSISLEPATVATGEDKLEALSTKTWKSTIAIGNGCNDIAMLRAARLGIVVLGPEGTASELLRQADIVVRDIRDALDLLLHPRRLMATLRK